MAELTKTCSRCKEEKNITEFNKKKDGYQYLCKLCQKNYCSEYYKKNKKRMSDQKKEYRKNNLKKVRNQERESNKRNNKTRKKYYKNVAKKNKKLKPKTIMLRNLTKEELAKHKKMVKKKYLEKTREVRLQKAKEYNSCPDVKKRRRKYMKNYIKNRGEVDKNFKLQNRARDLFKKSLKEHLIKKYKSFFSYTGISLNEYVEHLKQSVLWNDYISGKKIVIDHIIPVSAYDFNDENEIKKCWDKRNLRLLTAKENLKKHAKIDYNLIEQYNIKDLLPKK